MRLIEGLWTGISPRGRGARHHPQVCGGLVTGLAAADAGGRDHGVAGHGERWSREARRADPEAARIYVRGAVAARAVAVRRADREVTAPGPPSAGNRVAGRRPDD